MKIYSIKFHQISRLLVFLAMAYVGEAAQANNAHTEAKGDLEEEGTMPVKTLKKPRFVGKVPLFYFILFYFVLLARVCGVPAVSVRAVDC